MVEDEPGLTDAELDAKFAAIRAKLGTPVAKSRGGKEKKLKGRMKRSVLNKTWRSERFTFCCRADLKKRIRAVVKRDGLVMASVMEEAIEEWLRVHGGVDEGGDVE